MSTGIIPTSECAAYLRRKYEGVEVPLYKLRKLFAREAKLFFDCKDDDKASCLIRLLSKPDFPSFRIYLVVKGSGGYSFMDVNFRNVGNKETLEHFIKRYHQQLESMTKLSLQGAEREYVKCVGHGYEETIP